MCEKAEVAQMLAELALKVAAMDGDSDESEPRERKKREHYGAYAEIPAGGSLLE